MSRNIQKKENNPTFEYLIGFFASKNRFSTTTYINLQDAYVVEANALGTWSKVGYTGPGTTSSNGNAQGGATGVFWYKEGSDLSKAQWYVQSLQKLNDCAAQDKAWGLQAKISGGAAEGQSNAVYATGGQTKCLDLTPSFAALTSGRYSSGYTAP